MPPRSRCHIHDEVDTIESSSSLSDLFPQEGNLRQIHSRERVGDNIPRVRASPEATSSSLRRASPEATFSLRFRPVRHTVDHHGEQGRNNSSTHREISGRSLETDFCSRRDASLRATYLVLYLVIQGRHVESPPSLWLSSRLRARSAHCAIEVRSDLDFLFGWGLPIYKSSTTTRTYCCSKSMDTIAVRRVQYDFIQNTRRGYVVYLKP